MHVNPFMPLGGVLGGALPNPGMSADAHIQRQVFGPRVAWSNPNPADLALQVRAFGVRVPLNLVGPITAYGGQTYVTSQTGTGSTFAMSASPTFTGTVTADVLTTTGNTTLGNAQADTLNVGNGDIIKDASGNVGIGDTPSYRLHVRHDQNGSSRLFIDNRTSGTAATALVRASYNNDTQIVQMVQRSPGFTTVGMRTANSAELSSSGNTNGLSICTFDSAPIRFGTANTEQLQLSTLGQLLGQDGTAANPTFSFSSSGNGDNGVYLAASNAVGIAAAGALVAQFSSGAVAITGTLSAAGLTVTNPASGALISGVGYRLTSTADAQAWSASNAWHFNQSAWTRTASTAAVMWGTGVNAGTFEVWTTATGDAQSTAPSDSNSRIKVNSTGLGVGMAPARALDVTGTFGATGAATLGSTLGVTGDLAVNTNKFTVAASSGNTVVAGTLTVTGATNRVGNVNLTGQTADLSASALTVSATGWYRVSWQIILTTAASTSSTLPTVAIFWTDPDSSVEHDDNGGFTDPISSSANTVGLYVAGFLMVYAKTGTTIAYTTTGYASSGGTAMQYSFRLNAEKVT